MNPSSAGSRQLRRNPWLEIFLLVAFCGFLFFFGLNSVGLVGADEPRYAQISREMLNRRDWVTPLLNGKPWLEKPVLYYWETMLSYALTGVSDWSARLPGAINASACVLAVYLFMWRFVGRGTKRYGVQLDAALILASCAFIVGFGRAGSTDMPLTASVTIAMLCWIQWWLERDGTEPRRRGRWLVGFYGFLALGTLAKGPVAPLLAAVIIVCFAALRRKREVLQATAYWPGILLYFAIAVPWYWLVQVRTGSFLRVFLLEHNLERFSTGVYHHTQPIWYFVPVMLVAVAPWTVLVLAGFVDAVRRSNIHSPASDEPDLDLLLVLWAALPFFFFSLSRSKLPGYILPSVPPSAMMAAIWLRRKMAAEEPLPRILTLMHALLAGGMLLVILLSPTLVLHLHPPPAAVTMATIAGALVFSTVFLAVRYRGTAILRFVTLVPVFLGLTFLLRIAAPVLDQGLSVRPLAREIAAVTPKNTVVAAYNIPRDVEYGLTFYFDQPIARYENHNVPEGDHALLSRDASEQQLDSLAPGRRFIPLGGLTHQDLVLYWVTEKAKY